MRNFFAHLMVSSTLLSWTAFASQNAPLLDEDLLDCPVSSSSHTAPDSPYLTAGCLKTTIVNLPEEDPILPDENIASFYGGEGLQVIIKEAHTGTPTYGQWMGISSLSAEDAKRILTPTFKRLLEKSNISERTTSLFLIKSLPTYILG